MTIVFNADTGISTPGVTNSGNETVSGTLQVGSITTNLYPLVSGTAVASTSGTSIDFTGIPSWVKRITVMFQGVSTNGTNAYQIQIGSGTISTSGYLSSGANVGNAGTPAVANFTTGFGLMSSTSAAGIHHGTVWITNLSGNNWVQSGVLGRSDSAAILWSGGSIALSGVLDRIKIIGSATGSPSDTFDAGSINVMWE